MGVGYRNSEGYWDPVPFAAAANVDREAKKYRPLVYICSPYRGDPERNAERARRYSRFAVDQGMIPLAPHLLLPQYMKEEKERDLILFMDLVLLGKCSEVWVFGSEITDGSDKSSSLHPLQHPLSAKQTSSSYASFRSSVK